MNAAKRANNSGIQVISRAASILRILGEDGSGLSLGQIARRANLPRSTVQRIVAALNAEGFVTSDQSGGGLTLGPEIRALAQPQDIDTQASLKHVMRQIADDTGETVDLARLDGGQMLFLDQIVGSQRLRTVSSIGDRFPVTTTANGKAALAILDEAEAARRVISELEHDKTSGRSLPRILLEIDGIRNGALATDEDEHTDGISALGLALRDSKGEIYAISVPVPSSRFGRMKARLSEVMITHRARLSRSFECSDPGKDI